MKTQDRLAVTFLALFALAALGVLLWFRSGRAPAALVPGAGLEAPRSPEPGPAAATSSTDVLANEPPSAERAALPANAPAALARPAEAGVVTAIVARLLDESGRPLPGAWLGVDGARVGAHSVAEPDGHALAGADGVATLHWRGEGTLGSISFQAGAAGRATAFAHGQVKAGETLHLGDLVLRPGGAVSGVVLDPQQQPVSGADVVIANPAEAWGENDLEHQRSRGPELYDVLQSKSGADGRFRVEGVGAGVTRAWAHGASTRWALSEPLEVPARSEVCDVRLVLEPEAQGDPTLAEIRGIVLAPDGQPVARASIGVRQHTESSSWVTNLSADAQGRFHVRPERRGAHIMLTVSDPDQRCMQARLEDVKAGERELVVQLEAAAQVLLLVSDEAGPLENFSVSWSDERGSTSALAPATQAHAGGRLLLAAPAPSFWFVVQAPGHRPERLGPLDGRRAPAELAVRLASIPGIVGRVLDGETPVEGAELELHEQPRDAEIEVNGFASLIEPEAQAQAKTDAQGAFRIDLARDGIYAVLVDAPGRARALWGPLELQAARGARDVVIRVDSGGALEGRVLVAAGRSPAGVIVSVNRGDAHPQTQVVGPEGVFRFERLAAGYWELGKADETFSEVSSVAISSGPGMQPRELRRDVLIAVGETARKDLDLRGSGPATLEISLRHNGAAALAWSVNAHEAQRHTFTSTPPAAITDSSGHARLELDEAGAWTLIVRPPPELASPYEFRTELTLHAGANEWSHEVHSARLEGLVASWAPGTGARLQLTPQGAPQRESIQLPPDASGRFLLPLIESGAWTVLRLNGDQSAAWEKIAEFTLVDGESKTLSLP